VVAREIVGGEEEGDAPAGLVADAGLLVVGGGAGEEDGGGVWWRAGRADGDPALGRDHDGIAGALVLLGLDDVLDQLEAELADVEGERLVIIANDEGDVGEVGHGQPLVQILRCLIYNLNR